MYLPTGYTRFPNMKTPVNPPRYNARCELCSCTNRSKDCDAETGQCTNCRTGSTGYFCGECQNGVDNRTDCMQCRPGYYGLYLNKFSGCGRKYNVFDHLSSSLLKLQFQFISLHACKWIQNPLNIYCFQNPSRGILNLEPWNQESKPLLEFLTWDNVFIRKLLFISACNCILSNTLYSNQSVCAFDDGQCNCKGNISGRICDRCHENAYNNTQGQCIGKNQIYPW